MRPPDDDSDIQEAHEWAQAVRAERRAQHRPFVYLHHRGRPADDAVARAAVTAVKAWWRRRPGGTAAVVEELTHEDVDHRVAVLSLLNQTPARGFNGRDIAAAVIDNFRHADRAVVWSAAWLCGRRHVPGASEAALEIARLGPVERAAELIALAVAHRDKDAVVAVAARWLPEAPDSRQRSLFEHALKRLAWESHPAAGTAAREALRSAGIRWSLLYEPVKTWPQVRAALRPVSSQLPVDEIVELAASLFGNYSPVVAVGTLARGSDHDALVERIVADHGIENDQVHTALLHIGGAAAQRWLLARLPAMYHYHRTEIMWALEGSTLQHVLFRCRDAGLIAEMPVDTVKRLRDEHWGGYDDAEFRLFNPFVDVLVSLGAAVSYRWEPGEEIRYDRLLRRFGRCMPWFPLEAVAERVTPSTDPREATTRLLQFVAGGRRYRMDCDGTGSYVYGGDLAELLNRALEDARHPERFFCVRCDEQWVFVFGLPDVVHELARTIYLPLFDEPALLDDAARRFVEART